MSRSPATWALLLVLAAWVSRSPQGNTGQIAASSLTPQVPQASGGAPSSKGAQLLSRHLALKDPTTTEQLRTALANRGDTLDVLLATLPHPRASHLDWAFDTHLDSIRRAYERAGFVLDEYFLPWRDPSASAEDHLGPHQPGVLLFRELPRASSTNAKTSLWLVYLIPETSTGGIDKQAFSEALTERALLLPQPSDPNSPGPDLLIVGPVLSGSAHSLRTALDVAAKDPSMRLEEVRIRIVSGAATSPKNGSVLAPPADKRTTFESTLHTDDTLQRVLRYRVLPELGIEQDQLAVLQESSTAYGQEFGEHPATGQVQSGTPGPDQGKPPTDQFLRVPFPMSLASLRSAAVAIPDSDLGGTSAPGRTAPTQTKFDLSDAPRPRETMPAASGLTPASIDILLEEIARMLGRRGIKAVLLVATDVRDKLFLGRELKRRLPNLQLFTTEGNVLYLRPEYNAWLRGMLVVSTYPILLRDPAWRPQSSDGQQYAFANEGAEGTFNAVLVQLGKLDILADYGHPLRIPVAAAAGDPILERPPVWLTAVGAGTMLPVAVYDSPVDGAQSSSSDTPLGDQLSGKPREAGWAPSGVTERQSVGGLLAVFGTALLSLVFIAVAAVGECRAGKLERLSHVKPAQPWEERQRQVERVSLQIHRECFVLSRYLALAGLLLPNVVLIDLLAPHGTLAIILTGALASVAIVSGGLGICHRTWRVLQVLCVHMRPGIRHARSSDWPTPADQRAWKAEIVLRGLSLLLAPAYMALTLLVCWAILRTHASSDPTRYALFFNRAIEIDEGISPLLPMMLLGVTLLTWCTWHVQRVRMLTASAPAQELIDPKQGRRAGEVWKRLFQAMPDVRGIWVAFAILLGGAWSVLRLEPTLDRLCLDPVARFAPFDWLLRLGIAGSLGASIWAAYRLVSVWTASSQVLARAAPWVEALPFKDLVDKVGLKPSLGLWPSTGTRELDPFATDRWMKLRTLGVPGEGDTQEQAELLNRLRELAPRRGMRLHGHHERRAPESSERPAWVVLAQELVAIEVLLYVEWSLRQLRLLCVFLLVSLVLTTILVSSYPLRPSEAQDLALIVFAGVVVVLVWLIGSLSRDPALSRMTGTTPGQLTWDRTLYTNLGLYALVPTITLLSSQFPAIRGVLMDWIRPLMDSMVR